MRRETVFGDVPRVAKDSPIFNSYTIYQQVMIKRLGREFSSKIEEMRILQARVEEIREAGADRSADRSWVGYEKGETTEQFLERADRTLYAEKCAGKIRDREPSVAR